MNAIETQVATSNAQTVVQNDTIAIETPTIKLSELGVAATVKVATETAQKLVTMEQARISWETNELATSNKRLYSILKDAYAYYLVMKKDESKEVRKACTEEMEQFIKVRGYSFMPTTHDMTRVVKCVFGVDRRRVSAYSIALREALRQEVTAGELVEFIEMNGGVEQVRLGGSKPLSVAKRAEKAKPSVLNADLGMLKFDPVLFAADSEWTDKQVVIVATYLPTGEFQANAVIKHESAVNAALAAYYSQQQAQVRAEAKALREAELEAGAAEKSKAIAEAKAKKKEAQKAKVAAEVEAAQKTEAFNAHLNTLIEPALA